MANKVSKRFFKSDLWKKANKHTKGVKMKTYELTIYKKNETIKYKGSYYTCLWLLDKYQNEDTELIELEENNEEKDLHSTTSR